MMISLLPSLRGAVAPALTRLTTAGLLAALALPARAAEPPSGPAILQDLRGFRELGSVLHIAAHPDDENTQQITYLSRGRHYRTAYLSITRGDGGQNEIGREFDAELGLARTHELLAARRVDGGRQYFTRALDFGFSKDYEETLRIWDREQVLGDVVRVIRMFRPDVITTAFSPVPGTTHGHHTASAVLALEAFELAGDPAAYPEHFADGLAPWQPRRIFTGAGGGGGTSAPSPDVLRLEIGGTDPVSGESFSVISNRSRRMHITQFGLPDPAAPAGGGGRGGAPGANPVASLRLAGGDPVTTDIMDGIDTTWARIPGAAEIGRLADEVIAKFNPQDPSASVPALLDLRARLAALTARDPLVDEKRALLDRILQDCLGLTAETTLPQAEAVPGEALSLTHAVLTRTAIPVRWLGTRYPATGGALSGPAVDLAPNRVATRDDRATLPADIPVSQPYWLREPATAGMFRVAESKLIGLPENPPAFPVEFLFEVGGQQLVVPTEPVQVVTRPGKPAKLRRLDVIAPVTLHFASIVKILAPGASGPVEIEVQANRAGSAGTLRLDVPAGWSAAPAAQDFRLTAVGDKARFTFTVTAPAQTTSVDLRAHVEIDGHRYDTDRAAIDYDHLPLLLLQPPARIKAVSVELATRGFSIGYLPGAGDDVAECLVQMGYAVTTLTGADLTAERLRGFDAVVIGVRAFNERTDLAPNFPGLLAYVEAGGTVVAQYNRPTGLVATQLGPYELSIAGPAPALRVTNENAPVSLLLPDHPAVTSPNRIRPSDFEGWVQERGAYYPSSWDPARYETVLAMSDPGEPPLNSSLLVAKHGRGHYVYTGLAFFRQLPKGVPGAYRLFANLVSLGK